MDREDVVGILVGGRVGITVGDAARLIEESVTSIEGGSEGAEILAGASMEIETEKRKG